MGAIFIKNNLCKSVGEKILKYRELTNNIVGQNILGFIINSETENWYHFKPGFNVPYNENRNKYILDPFLKKNKIFLFHYINLSKDNKFFNKYVKKYYNFIHKKYNI